MNKNLLSPRTQSVLAGLIMVTVVSAKAEEQPSLLENSLNGSTLSGYVDSTAVQQSWAEADRGSALMWLNLRPLDHERNTASVLRGYEQQWGVDTYGNLSTVPEPSAIALSLVAAAALFFAPLRRKRPNVR